MSKEAIDAVLEAEARAKEAKSRVSAKAHETIAKATEDAKSRFDETRKTAMNDMNDKLSLITEQAEALLGKSRAEAEAEAEEQTKGAMAHMDDAVALIIGELLQNADK